MLSGRAAPMALSFQPALCGLVVLTVAACAASAGATLTTTIDKPNFNVTSDMSLAGSATWDAGLGGELNNLTLTKAPAHENRGAAWHTDKQLIYHAFETTFTFRMRDQQFAGNNSDGITFTIQNQSSTALGGYGGALGAMTNLTRPAGHQGISSAISICFDTWDNSTDWDVVPGVQRLFIQSAGDAPNLPTTSATLASTSVAPLKFNDAQLHTARIAYTRGQLSVYVDDMSVPRLTAAVTLDELFTTSGGYAWVGFTAGTGGAGGSQRHEIVSWTFASEIPAPGAAGVLLCSLTLVVRRSRRR